MKTKEKDPILVLRVVNISREDYEKLAQFIRNQQVQFELPLSELPRENLVNNLFDNVNRIDLASEQYENSPTCPHVIDRVGRNVFDRQGRS